MAPTPSQVRRLRPRGPPYGCVRYQPAPLRRRLRHGRRSDRLEAPAFRDDLRPCTTSTTTTRAPATSPRRRRRPDGFEAAAVGDLDGDGDTSLFATSGNVTGTTVTLRTTLYTERENE
ncbi:MAG: hypothetical protein R3B70_29525 [Polyangiaceae bacterium]